jgi:isocitrate dehydrogenase (NAD+)
MARQITLIPGDGIGPEVAQATIDMVAATGLAIDWDTQQAGVVAVEACGKALPDATLASIERTGLALKGPTTTPIGTGHVSANVGMRRALSLYASVRPVRSLPGIKTRYENVDLVIFRENTEGLYAGLEQTITPGVVVSMKVVTEAATRRIATAAFEFAQKNGRKKVTIVHKANVLKALTGLFLEAAKEVARKYEGRVACDERIVDACAMQLVMNPWQFDVIVTTNLFGDILSDEIAGLVGGLGMAPAANIGVDAAIFEAVHGSAPDIAGRGIANPLALMLSSAMMLDHAGEQDKGRRLRRAIDQVLREDNVRTGDLGGKASTREFTQAVAARLR